jgi:hypothetical protein
MNDALEKLTPELIRETKETWAKLVELKSKGIFAISPYTRVAQITTDLFDISFPEYTERLFENNTVYLAERKAVVDGITFMALYRKDERGA